MNPEWGSIWKPVSLRVQLMSASRSKDVPEDDLMNVDFRGPVNASLADGHEGTMAQIFTKCMMVIIFSL